MEFFSAVKMNEVELHVSTWMILWNITELKKKAAERYIHCDTTSKAVSYAEQTIGTVYE